MSDKEHRLGVSEINLMVRHLKLESVDKTKLQAAIAEVDQLYGLDAISFDEKSHVLNLAYDASRICLDGIEEILEKHGVEVDHNWWTHLKETYYKFVDENVRDSAGHPAWSCHNPPSNTERKP